MIMHPDTAFQMDRARVSAAAAIQTQKAKK